MVRVQANSNKSQKLRRWFVVVVVVATVVVSGNVAEAIGVNWGTIMAQPIEPETVVQMLKDIGIKQVKLFDADPWVVKSLAGSGIEVMIAIPNNELFRFSNNYDNAKEWVKENVTSYLKDEGGVDIRYVAVGNEPFLKSYNGSYMKTTFPSLKNIQKALDEAGVGDKIKATIPCNADVYDSHSDYPSDGNFRVDIRPLMVDIVKFLNSSNAPFFVNIYPFLSLYQDENFPVDYAFFDGNAKPTIDDNYAYTNVFEANFDTLVWALKKTGFPDLKIAIGEIGWPTDGDKHATVENAKRFYDGYLSNRAKGNGTHLRPDAYENVYFFGLLDENMKSVAPGDFERHWGIFTFDGKPKFPVDFTGKGNDTLPVGAKGVKYMKSQWCVFNNSSTNMTLVTENVEYACTMGDCTSLGYGSSCNQLGNTNENISYAYNYYYQMQGQLNESCDFNGTAKITNVNASQDGCLFPILVASTHVSSKVGGSVGGGGHDANTGYHVNLLMPIILWFLFFTTLMI
ncbi:glucan endo-1,3-beta-glucosidase 8-like [Telopea speciosissima]|uniref:glucan endo-1,3-beta-glucosidase 8-like n=1 Tax=Telopea speciosissima TaxID=54955 RepID=UPI001CC6F62A|nr:glucan endo-1,3-beta-glucosidase 8-like [Telopea speciosissima]